MRSILHGSDAAVELLRHPFSGTAGAGEMMWALLLSTIPAYVAVALWHRVLRRLASAATLSAMWKE